MWLGGAYMPFIDDIFIIDDIFSLEEQAEKKYHIPIPNVSYWDSSPAFQKQMAKILVLPELSLPWNYYYTYSISAEDRQQVLRSLGVPDDRLATVMGLLLQSSTIAIVNMINLLVHHHLKRLCILQPAYFSVASCCSMFSLDYGIEQMSFVQGQPQIPLDRILTKGYDCIWLTSPIFCTGYYPDETHIRDIAQLRDAGMTVIFDESLALPGKELIRSFPVDHNLFAIYSPHKAISINGLKFAVIVCDKRYEDFLEQWVDVFSGALGGSNRDAVFHYLSPNYLDCCYPAYKQYIKRTKAAVERVVERFPFASMLPNTEGHYVNIFTDLNVQGGHSIRNFLEQTIQASMASFIPSELNGFAPEQGFGFRVNLTGDSAELEGAVGRILQHFDTLYH